MKSKYTQELVDSLIEALEETGSDKDSCKIVGISRECFYSWLKKYPDFGNRAIEARAFYQQHCSKTLKRLAADAFLEILKGKATRVSITKEEITHEDGSISTKLTTRTVTLEPSRWAIERVLGATTDLFSAIACLADHQILPRWVIGLTIDEMRSAKTHLADAIAGTLRDVPDEADKPLGISESTANMIRSKILGLTPPTAPTNADQN